MPIERKRINGKNYLRWKTFKRKSNAQKFAEKQRKLGELSIRIVKKKEGYVVYRLGW